MNSIIFTPGCGPVPSSHRWFAAPLPTLLILLFIATGASCNLARRDASYPDGSQEMDVNSGAVHPNGASDASAKMQDASGNGVKSDTSNTLNPSRRPADGLGQESIPQLLARTRNDLRTEQDKSRKALEDLTVAEKRVADLLKTQRELQTENDTLRLERDRGVSRIRDLQERLVTAGLSVVENEKTSLGIQIKIEQIVRAAAQRGVIIDINDPANSPPQSAPAAAATPDHSVAASRPAPDVHGPTPANPKINDADHDASGHGSNGSVSNGQDTHDAGHNDTAPAKKDPHRPAEPVHSPKPDHK